MFVSLNGALTPKVSGADKVRLAAKVRVRRGRLGLRPGEGGGPRGDQGALRRGEDQADDHEPADGAPAAIRGRRRGISGRPEGARRGCGIRVGRRVQEDDARPSVPRRPRPRTSIARWSSSASRPSPRCCRRRTCGWASSSSGRSTCGQARGATGAADPVHLDASGNGGPGERLRSQHGCRAGRLALAPLRRHARGHRCRRQRSDRARAHLRREAHAARRCARQHADDARRREHRSRRVSSGARRRPDTPTASVPSRSAVSRPT